MVRLVALKQPCRAVGIFVVLDLTTASPAAFMQALLSMWKIITNICGSVGPLCLWVYIAKGPCSLRKGPHRGHGPPLQLQTLVCCLMALFAQQEPPIQPFHRKGEANKNVVVLFSNLETRSSRLMS